MGHLEFCSKTHSKAVKIEYKEYKNEFTSSMYNGNNNYGFPVDYCTSGENAKMGSNVANITSIIARSVLKYALGDTQIGDLQGNDFC